MTTEILQSLLHTNDPLVRSIGTVIFDEAHYLRNTERGMVYENCVIMLDTRVPIIFLSATVGNSVELA